MLDTGGEEKVRAVSQLEFYHMHATDIYGSSDSETDDGSGRETKVQEKP
jgi:hypothetical protein